LSSLSFAIKAHKRLLSKSRIDLDLDKALKISSGSWGKGIHCGLLTQGRMGYLKVGPKGGEVWESI
jgi:hypothetical protein